MHSGSEHTIIAGLISWTTGIHSSWIDSIGDVRVVYMSNSRRRSPPAYARHPYFYVAHP